MAHKRRGGFSLIELVIVILIMGILSGIGINFGVKQLERANLQAAANDLQLMATDMESGIGELGYLIDMEDSAAVTTYFQNMDWSYMSAPIDTSSIVITGAGGVYGDEYYGCSMTTKDKSDPWGTEYVIYYLVNTTSPKYRIVFASAGPDGLFSPGAECAYDNTLFDFENKLYDDVILIMESR